MAAVPDFRLDGRHCLITGGGRGIGAAVAAAYAKAGAEVVVAARSREEIEAVAASIRSDGGRAHALELDVTDVAAVSVAVASLPQLDVLFNNAGTNRPKPIAEVTEADFDVVVGLNLKAAYFVAQAAAVKMAAQGTGGAIINVSSQMGHVGASNRTLYCATKHGLEGLTKALAIELAPNGIRVNSLAPTFVETPMTASYLADPGFRANVLSKIKLGRLATIDDIVGAAVFLASEAAGFITGTSLLVDGGWTAD
jgi:NAD(P)-dependent dehydrogenase (short-subunit alcohol dehydrogenase family)